MKYVKARVGKYVIVVYKKKYRMANNAFYGCEKVEKVLWFCDFFIFKRQTEFIYGS